MTAQEFVQLLEVRGFTPRKNASGWTSRCPAHDDRRPSLSIRESANGTILLKCHTGCHTQHIVGSLGLRFADLRPKGSRRTNSTNNRQIVAQYDYRDENGVLLAQKVRYEPKGFAWRRPNHEPAGPGWIYNRLGPMPLYRLPEVVAAVREHREILVCEGEKDADLLAKRGLAATTCPDGADKSGKATKWRKIHTEALRGARVIIIADKDETGRKFACGVAAEIHGSAESVRIIEVPEIDGRHCKDPADYLGAGGDLAKILAIAQGTPDWTPTAGAERSSDDAIPTVYDSGRGTWWTKNDRGSWIELNETGVRRILKSQGYFGGVRADLSPLDARLLELQRRHDVAFAGSLAGWSEGIHELNSQRILVTISPNIIHPKEGSFPTIRRLLEGMLRDQLKYFVCWLKFRRIALLRRSWRPSQALALCGPRNCGKSLTQQLVSWSLGGREASPWRYMSGSTDFNGELFGAEHLTIQDSAASTDIRARRHFGAHIKSMLFSRIQSCHAKNRQAVSLEPSWALSISVNDEPENLMVLPPLDESLKDKMMLLKCFLEPMPMPTETEEQRCVFESTLRSELPAFLHFVDKFEVPPDIVEPRCGVVAYQDQEILRELADISPEADLLNLIDNVIFAPHLDRSTWEGTAGDLERELRKDTDFRSSVERLLRWSQACGTYMHRLEHAQPGRFRFYREAGSGRRMWCIRRG